MALCDQDDVEALLYGYTFATNPDPVITTLIELVQGEMEGPRGADRAIEADDYTETFDAPFWVNVWLENTPINSLASVTEDGSVLVSGTDFLLYDEQGKLKRITSGGHAQYWKAYKPQSIEVQYNGGYTTVPNDLRKACAEAVARLFRAGVSAAATLDAGGDGVKRVRLDGSDEIEYFEAAAVSQAGSSLIDTELATARAYRRKVVA